MKNLIIKLFLVIMSVCTPLSLADVVYVHNDALGSPIMESDANGVTVELHYKPFGETLEAMQDDVGYTGHLNDADLGLTYMQARYYDPVIGRFYSNDPVGFTSVHNFNRYAYANNNPYKYTDPDGRDAISITFTLNVPGIMEYLPISGDSSSMQGIQLSINATFPGASDNGSWGAGLSIDGVVGKELGTESSVVKDGKISTKSLGKSLVKPSGTVGLSYDSEINNISEMQNGTSKPEIGGQAGGYGGAVIVNNNNEVTGGKLTVGAGLNVGTTVTKPIVGVAVDQDKGFRKTGGN